MSNLPPRLRIANTAAVLDGPYGAVTQHAQHAGLSRQALYRDAPRVLRAVEGTETRRRLQTLQDERDQLHAQVEDLRRQLQQARVLTPEQLARFAATAQAEGVSLPVARRLLRVFLKERTPSVAQLGRWTHAAAQKAAALLPVLDAAARPQAQQVAADEIFFGRRPCLMIVEQQSLCWLTGRLAEDRTGPTWAAEFRPLPNLQQVTRDGGTGLAKGVALVNQERQAREQPTVADQEDHFHTLREGGRALRRSQRRVEQAIAAIAAARQREQRQAWRTGSRQGTASVTARAERAAQRAVAAGVRVEQAWAAVRAALPLFTPTGELNSRSRAEGLIAAALPALEGPEWSKTRRALGRPELLTFLDQVHGRLAALPVSAAVRDAVVQAEGLRQRPELLSGEGPSAAALRGVLLVTGALLAGLGEAGASAVASVRSVLGTAWRASSLVECLNSVARMQQSRHRRMTAGLLDLKRLYWNCRVFRTGRRRDRTPYGMLGVRLPTTDWWELLKLPPELLRQQLSTPGVAD